MGDKLRKLLGRGPAVEPGIRVPQAAGSSVPATLTRRRFTQATAAAGAGLAVISLIGCSSDEAGDVVGEPQVVTDDSQIIGIVDGDYENVDSSLAVASSWTYPLGTMLFHAGGCVWAAAMLTPESATSVNTLGVMSLTSGSLMTLMEAPTSPSMGTFFDVRCTDSIYAWVEINYNDRSWALFGQTLAGGSLVGSPVQLDQGTADWEPPRLTVWGSSVIWQKMPLATGERSAEPSHCYIWTDGADEGVEICKSPGRFATAPRISGDTLTITPRVRDDEGVYYGITALDITTSSFDRIAQLVLPRSVAPFEATYMNETFVFSIEASYEGVGSLGNMGTYIGVEGGPYQYVRREPLAQAAGRGARCIVKSQSSHFVVDVEAQTYAVQVSPDRALDYGDYPATEGESDLLLTYATVRDDAGRPASVTARVFGL